MSRGLVIKNTGSLFLVQLEDGSIVETNLRGRFRLKGIRSTNPVVVGDVVGVEGESIVEIEPRKNYIIRKSSNLSKESHILASNIDQVFLVVTIKKPETPFEFIDRFLLTANAYHIPVVIVLNKVDILDDDEMVLADAIKGLYQQNLGYKVIFSSVLTGEGVEEVRLMLKDKLSLFSGNSGVGKSSLLNALEPSLDLKVGDVSRQHQTGMHTTTYSEVFSIADGKVIDSPGIKGFGIIDMEASDISKFFPDIAHYARNCRFDDCKHINEPNCAVLEALEQQKIAVSRYNSYKSILLDLDEKKYR
ncbi:MAG: ribosome small subunit-dependent GTPase A [Paludibacteraceae bacterium]|nr:ribosome small subunit-dependent GTPase A [Paludibacteraceae bacterium]MBR6686386.1 ribosome small subunit-dependent GTPase A [Paludibacteraceae bacterium]